MSPSVSVDQVEESYYEQQCHIKGVCNKKWLLNNAFVLQCYKGCRGANGNGEINYFLTKKHLAFINWPVNITDSWNL